MRIKLQSENLLVLEDKPLISWIFFGSLIIGSVFLIIYSLLNQNVQIEEALIFAAFIIPFSFIFIYLSQYVSCRFEGDRANGILVLKRQNLFRKKVVKIHLGNIKDVELDSDYDDGSYTYRVSLVFKSHNIYGHYVPLTNYYSSGKKGKEKIVSCIKSFLKIDD